MLITNSSEDRLTGEVRQVSYVQRRLNATGRDDQEHKS